MPTNDKAPNDKTPNEISSTAGNRPRISLDTWAVIFALTAALLIRIGVLKHIPW